MVIPVRLIKPLLIVAFVLLGGSFSWPQSVTPASPTPEDWKESIHNISEADKTGKKDVVRQERSAAFNDQRPDAPKLDSPTPRNDFTHGAFPPYFVRTPAIPVQESDAVVVATVNSVQPYFSDDHAHLYTEFSLRVDEQIKDSSGQAKVNETIPVVIRGGRIRLADGRVLEERPAFKNFAIALGSRYLLFLRYNSVGRYFTVAKSWELKEGTVIPTAHEDQMDAKEGKTKYSSMTEKTLIKAAYNAAKTGKDQE